MTDPTVAVLVPVYNAMPWLEEAVASVLAQDFTDYELVLFDDGSTDGSAEYARGCAEAAPGRVRYCEHPGHANRGASPTRNAAAAATRSRYIAMLDADDRWLPGKLARQVALMEADPMLGMVADDHVLWRSWEGGEDAVVRAGIDPGKVLAAADLVPRIYPLGRAKAPCPSATLIRRSAWDAVGGFDERFVGPLQLYEDQVFHSKIYLEFPVLFTDRTGLFYRIHEASCVATNRREGRYADIRRRFLDWYGEWLDARHIDEPAVRKAWRRARRHMRHHRLNAALAPVRSLLRRLHDRATGRRPRPVPSLEASGQGRPIEL